MFDRSTKILLVLIALALWGMALRPMFAPSPVEAQVISRTAVKDNEELKRMSDEDQADRTLPEGKSIDWTVLHPRDRARLKRVKELYAQNLLQSANDYDHAATVLQHGDVPEDFLLAHELWFVAIFKGKNDADTKSLAAASEDRYLMNVGRPQRFGTQLRSVDGGPIQLYPVGFGVTDELRRQMGVHPLAEIRARVIEMNKK